MDIEVGDYVKADIRDGEFRLLQVEHDHQFLYPSSFPFKLQGNITYNLTNYRVLVKSTLLNQSPMSAFGTKQTFRTHQFLSISFELSVI